MRHRSKCFLVLSSQIFETCSRDVLFFPGYPSSPLPLTLNFQQALVS